MCYNKVKLVKRRMEIMKFRNAIAILLAAVMVIALPFFAVISVSSSTSENLGAISECVVDKSTEKITIRGSLKHGVLVNNREAKLAEQKRLDEEKAAHKAEKEAARKAKKNK